jgi:glycosyltransferase involved in cell wall biosynthesis
MRVLARKRLQFVVESGTDVRLVEGLAERFQLSILARRIAGGVEISHPPAVTVPTVIGPGSRLGFARFAAGNLWRQRKQIDVTLVQGYSFAALAANLVGRLTRKPTFMLVCSPVEAYYECRKTEPDPAKPFRSWELRGLKALAKLNALVGQRYVVLSQYLAQVVRSHGGSRPVHLVPLYGVETGLFHLPQESKAVLRRKRGLPAKGALIFFSSRIAPEKDAASLLRAFHQLIGQGRDLLLLYRGGGYRMLLSAAQALGVGERVIATDAVHPHRELPLDYQACDLLVQASRAEGLGFSVLEAMACGLPVVASAVGGLRETVIDGETGWTYPVGDSVALARCIEQILAEPVEAARRTAKARDLVLCKYSRQVVLDELVRMTSAGE